MTKIESQNLVNFFNTTFPVGSMVQLRKVNIEGFPYAPHKVRYPAYVASSGQPVAFFEGITGFFSIEPEFIQYQAQEGGVQV